MKKKLEYRRKFNKEKGYYEHHFRNYLVKEESNNFFGVYLNNYNKKLITSKTNLKQALKTVKLLEEAYSEGYEDAQEQYDEYYFRR